MTAATPERITITDEIVQSAQGVVAHGHGASLVLRSETGDLVDLPPGISDILLRALAAVADNEGVAMARIPDQLTSTVAAELLGVSRPTLNHWADEEKIPSFKVGTHRRFLREDVMALKIRRHRKQRQAFDELLALDQTHAEEFAD